MTNKLLLPKGWKYVSSVLITQLMLESLLNMQNLQASTTTHPELKITVRFVAASSTSKQHPFLQIAE